MNDNISFKIFKTDTPGSDFLEADKCAHELLEYLEATDIKARINLANRPGNSSRLVQEIFLDKLMEMGFSSEKRGLFADYKNNALRPDYYKPLNDSGVIFEVERGKTIMNNMDLLDFWKCHICKRAAFLFLAVPKQLKHNQDQKSYNTFSQVCDRLSSFFEKDNYTNVKAVFIFGY